MKLLALLLALLLFVAGCSNSVDSSKISEDEIPALEWTWVPFDSDALQVSGRASYERSDCLILSWSATSITIAFVGTALELKSLSNSVVYLDVFVDGEEIPSSLVKISDYADGPAMVPLCTFVH